MSDATGRFVWYELLTTDPEAAKAFYGEVVGWSVQKWSDGDYSMFVYGEKPMGGLMTLPEEAKAMGAPPIWMAYVAVPDTDATVAQAKELGAKVLHEPESMPTVGRWAVLQDPQGAVFCPFTPEEKPEGPPSQPEVGMPTWHELATSDYKAAFDFYEALFGWKLFDDMDMGEAGVYRIFGHVFPLGGMLSMQGPPSWVYYFGVEDLDAAVGQAQKNGGKLLHGPQEVPGGDRIAQIKDPQGAVFALHWSKPKD